VAGTYIAQLIVTDGSVNSKPGTVTISTQNRPPVANAGVAQTVALQSTVQLDGTTSSDPDGDTLTFTWSLLSKPTESAAVLSNIQIARPTFVADMPGSYVAQLIVNDGKLSSAPATVTISTDDSAPIANAGPDQTVPAGSTVQLDGSGSNDPDGSSLFYTWSFTTIPQGSAATFSNPLIAKPTFLADKRGTYVGQLIVGDGTLVSAPDTVMITAANRSPTAQDDSAITAMNTAVIVNVLANDSDPDGDPLSVTGVGQPANGKAVANANNTVTYTPAAAFVGSDSFTYSISDGQGGTAGATVRITVNPISGCPAPVITSIDPLSGPVGTEVTITGTNLDCGNTRTLTLNGVTLLITSLTPTQIKTFIPIGAQDGAFTVTTDGGSVTQQQLAYDVVLSQDFQLNVLPPSAAVMPGGSTNYVIEVALSGATRFTGTAILSASGLPTGASAFFSPAVVTAGQKATLTVSTSAITPLGTSSFQVNATATIDAQISAKSASAQLQVLPSGTTALAGSVLDTDGNPISGVTIRIGSIPSKFEAVTNAAGSFLLLDPPVGTQLIFVDGQTVPNIKYPTIPINATIVANTVNQLPFTPFLHAQKDQNFTLIDPTKDTIVTDPELPGVTLRIPAGTQIIGWDGQPNQKVSMRAVPIDRLPIPPPPSSVLFNIVYMFYFGKVGGGTPTQPIPFSAPNDLGMEPGDKAELWYFDESPIPGGAPNDWRMAGLGTVSTDGTTIVSDPGVGIPKFCCGAAAYNKRLATHGLSPGQSSPPGAGQPGGDPVDLATGIFTLTETDMVLPGRIPLVVTRSYRSGDIAIGPFGRGTTMSYDDILPVTAPGVLTYVYRGSARTQFFLQGDGSYLNNTVPAFRGARITINATTGIRTLRRRDGSAIDFDTGGLMVAVRDRNGNQITISRSFGLKATRVTDPVNRSLNFTKSGDLETSLTDPLGRTVTYQYDGAARLIKVTKPDGSTTQYTYDSAHRMTSIIDGRGITYLKNTYDVNSRVCQQEQADGGKYKIYYVTTDRASFPESIQLLQQAASGGPISIAPCSAAFSTGTVVATVLVDPLGRPTTYRFNSLGFLISTTNALGQTMSLFRDSVTNQARSLTDTLGRTAQFEYDSAGNLTKLTDPAGNISAVEYDSTFNQVTKTTDPMGNITTFEYDNKGNVIAFIDPEQNLKPLSQRLKTTITYNSFGQPIGSTDVLGNIATFTYDALGNLSTITDPSRNTTRRNFDLVSRLISQTDPRGKTTKFAYDAVNRITQIVDALNGFTSFSYDTNGNLLAVTDARGNSITHTYDTMDRLATRADQLKRSETFSYDLNGNLTQATNRNGQTSTFQYDALNRRIGGLYADGTSVQFQLDTVGRLVRATDSAGGDMLFSYDNLDRLIAANAELGTLRYTYDKAGRRTSMAASGQPTVTYSYDANSRLRQVLRGSLATTLSYDALNRRTKLTLPNGVSTEYNYDADSRPTELVYKNFLGTQLGNITYQYDGAGNRRGIGGSLAQTLLPDAVTSANYDAANRQLQFGEKTMSYDPAGNLSSIAGPGGTTTLAWDARQRLVGLTTPAGTAVFAYDPGNRRRARQINGQSTQYFYDGAMPVLDQSVNVTNTYLNGVGIDQPWLRNSNEFYLADALGSTIGLTDASGAITSRYNYEPFGRSAVQGPSSNSIQFTGRENDGTGFYYYRARYYSPELHRFVSEDPLGLSSGDANLFSYVSNRPTNSNDPLGLKPDDSWCEDSNSSPSSFKQAGDYTGNTSAGFQIGDWLAGLLQNDSTRIGRVAKNVKPSLMIGKNFLKGASIGLAYADFIQYLNNGQYLEAYVEFTKASATVGFSEYLTRGLRGFGSGGFGGVVGNTLQSLLETSWEGNILGLGYLYCYSATGLGKAADFIDRNWRYPPGMDFLPLAPAL
jgi:RHS repeat-associated protein